MIRTLVIDAGFILATLVVALGSFFLIRAASGDAPHAEIATIRLSATPSATARATSTATTEPTLEPTASATSEPTATGPPTATPTPAPAVSAAATAPAGSLTIDAALGRNGPNICEASVTTTEDASMRRAVRSWNQLTAIWNGVAESEAQLNAAIPAPFTLENAAASSEFLAEARRHAGVVQAATDELVALRAAGIHTQTRPMSLRQGDFYDLDRLTTLQTIEGAENGDVDAWNEAAALDQQRTDYLDSARTEMTAVCEYVKQP